MNEEQGQMDLGQDLEGAGQEFEAQSDQGAQDGGEPQSVPITPDSLKEIINGAVSAATTRQGTPQQQQMSDEEVHRVLKTFKPDGDLFNRMRQVMTDGEVDSNQGAAVLQDMWAKMFEQAKTYAEAYSQYAVQQALQGIQPQLSAAYEVSQRQRQESFFKKYPGLKPYESLIPSVAQKLQNSGMQFRDDAHMGDELAKAVEATVKQFNPQFSLQAQGNGRKSVTPMFGGQQGMGQRQTQSRSGASPIWR